MLLGQLSDILPSAWGHAVPQLPSPQECESSCSAPGVSPGDQTGLQSKGSGWQDAPRSWVVQLQGAGLQLNPRAREERLQLPLPCVNPLCVCSIAAASAPETPLLLPGTQCPEAFLKGLFSLGLLGLCKTTALPQNIGEGKVTHHCSPPQECLCCLECCF